MSSEDITQFGLTERAHDVLDRLKKDGVFGEMVDGCRFGIALAVARGQMAPDNLKTTTAFHVGTLDPDGMIRDLVVSLYPQCAAIPYRVAQRLAEAGISEMGSLYDSGSLKFGALLESLSESSGRTRA